MRSPDRRPYSFPACVRCDVYLVKRKIESVEIGGRAPAYVQIYECPVCEKFVAEEIDVGQQPTEIA